MVEKSFDKKQLKQIDVAAKAMVAAQYDVCLHKCDTRVSADQASCKQWCFKNIMVPYHIVKHQALSSEENLFKQCLADKMPAIKQTDYAECTNNVYSQRVELLMTHFANSAEGLLSDIH